MNWRLNILEEDLASFNNISVNNTGGFVIKAKRGKKAPTYIQKEQDLIAFCGIPDADNYEIQEVIDYLSQAPVWISSPFYADALYGGVAVKATGMEALSRGIPDIAAINFAQFPVKQLVSTGDGSTKTFNKTLDNLTYVNSSCTKLVLEASDGTETEVTITPTNAATEVLSGTGLDTGSQLVRSSGALTLVFDDAPANDTKIYVQHNYVANDIRFLIMTVSPCDTWLGAKIKAKEAGADGIYTVYIAEKTVSGTYNFIDDYDFSLQTGKKNPAGKPVYIDTILRNNLYITYVINTAYTGTTGAIAEEVSYKDLFGGSRGTDITTVERNVGWDYFKVKSAYPCDLLLETSGESGVVTSFVNLVTNYQQYKAFGIITLPMGLGDASDIIDAKEALSINTDQLAFYCNWGEVENKYTGESFWSPLIGRDGRNMAKMSPVYNSLAPAGPNEQGYGGELGTGIIQLEQGFTDDDLESLDLAQINPHIYSPRWGYMTEGQKTASLTLTDTSYIGTRRLLNVVIHETIEQILELQLHKFNDPYHRQLFENRFEILVSPILSGDLTHPNGFCTELIGIADDERVNTTKVLERREFVALVIFKATPFSERITLRVARLSQGIEVTEFLGKL